MTEDKETTIFIEGNLYPEKDQFDKLYKKFGEEFVEIVRKLINNFEKKNVKWNRRDVYLDKYKEFITIINQDHQDQGVEVPEKVVEKLDEETTKYKAYHCYKEIIKSMNYYMDIPESHAKIISLWIIGTYIHKEFNSYPFLFINAMRGSGKSRLLNFISHLAWNGKLTNNITESVLFRTAKDHTIIIDENESIISKEKSTLRELLNSAYKKGVHVERMKKVKGKEGNEELVVDTFEMYCPITMANISGMEEVLSDRCVTLILEKSNDPIKTKLMEDFESNENMKEIKRTLDAIQCSLCNVVSLKNIKKDWNNYINSSNISTNIHTLTTLTTLTTFNPLLNGGVLENNNDLVDTLTTPTPNSPTPVLNNSYTLLFDKINKLEINGRNLELFFPLISIAELLHEDLIDEVLEITKSSVKEKMDIEYIDSPDVAVYEFVSKQDPLDYHQISDLLIHFKQTWVYDEGDKDWLNAMWFGRSLRRLKLVTHTRRISKGICVLLDTKKAADKTRIFKKDLNEVEK